VEMDWQRLPDGLVRWERGLVKHRSLSRVSGKPADQSPLAGTAGTDSDPIVHPRVGLLITSPFFSDFRPSLFPTLHPKWSLHVCF